MNVCKGTTAINTKVELAGSSGRRRHGGSDRKGSQGGKEQKQRDERKHQHRDGGFECNRSGNLVVFQICEVVRALSSAPTSLLGWTRSVFSVHRTQHSFLLLLSLVLEDWVGVRVGVGRSHKTGPAPQAATDLSER